MAIPLDAFLPTTPTSHKISDAHASDFPSSPPTKELTAQTALSRGQRQRNIMQNREQGHYAPRSSSRARQHQPQLGQLKHDGAPASASGLLHHSRPRGHGLALTNPGFIGYDQTQYDRSSPVPELISEDYPSLPDSPLSPRWDSLPNYLGRPPTSHASYERGGTTSNPHSPIRTRFALGPTSVSSRPASPFLSDSPRSMGPARQFPLVPRYDAQQRPLTPSASAPLPYQYDSSRPSTAASGSMVENFSRPRKPSIRQGEPAFPRTRAEFIAQSEAASFGRSSPSPSQQGFPSQQQWPRGRGNSGSSAQSSSTFASVAHRPSNEQLHSSRARYAHSPSPNPTTRVRLSDVHEVNNEIPHGREVMPWLELGGEEGRSSFRSQLTTSTAQGTVFSNGVTERSSVLTKYSSQTETSIINGYVRNSTRTISTDGALADVLGLYEKGFADDSDEEDTPVHRLHEHTFGDDDDTHEIDVGATVPAFEVSRPESVHSEGGDVGAKMLEAMSDPLPTNGLAVSNSNHVMYRDSAMVFRQPDFASSVPKDVGMGLASEAKDRWRYEVADNGVARHDSGKVIQGDDASSDSTDAVSPQLSQEDNHLAAPNTSPKATEALPPVQTLPTPANPAVQLPQEPIEELGSRDRYGFKKENNYITREQYDVWNGPYTEYLARRRKKWTAFLKENSLMTEHPNRFPPRSAKAKRFVRKGIPPEWRGSAWFYYAGGPAIMAKHHGVYHQLLARAGLDAKTNSQIPGAQTELKLQVVEDIEKDLHRTFPDNTRFKPARTAESKESVASPSEGSQATLANWEEPEGDGETRIISSLRRVLHAFALYNPRIGYCQSLNFLAGLLLLFVESEEHAFWLLNVITRVYLPGTHETSLEGSKVDLGVLMESLKDSMPGVWKHVAADEADVTSSGPKKTRGRKAAKANNINQLPPITLCMTAWFMSCFIGTLPIESVLRVWDVFFYEGSRTLFRISLAIFKLGEPEIKKVSDPMEMFSVVQAIPRRMIDCNALMEACYKRRNGIGHLSQDVVEERRLEARNGIRVWKAEQEASHLAVSSPMSERAAGLDLAGRSDTREVRRKNTLFSRRKEKDREQARAAEVV